MAQEWTEENIVRLIELIRDNPLLWDPDHEFYKYKRKRKDVFGLIAETLNVTRTEIERKWKIIRTQFRREYAKREANPDIGVDEVCPNSWFGYKHLGFLTEKIVAKKQRDGSESVLRLNAEDESKFSQDSARNSKQVPPKSKSLCVNSDLGTKHSTPAEKPAKKRFRSSEPTKKDTSVVTRTFQSSNGCRDVYMIFGEYVANKLRSYDLLTRAKVEHKINCLLHEADMKVLRENYWEPHPDFVPNEDVLSLPDERCQDSFSESNLESPVSSISNFADEHHEYG